MKFEKICDKLYTACNDFSLLKLNIGVRMSIIELTNGELILYSPIQISADLREKIDQFISSLVSTHASFVQTLVT